MAASNSLPSWVQRQGELDHHRRAGTRECARRRAAEAEHCRLGCGVGRGAHFSASVSVNFAYASFGCGGSAGVRGPASRGCRRLRRATAGHDRTPSERERARVRDCNAGWAWALQVCCMSLLAGMMQPAGAMKTIMGGSISWKLENDFEVSRNLTWTLKTVWKVSDVAYAGTGVFIYVGQPVVVPSQIGAPYASRFGNLKVELGDYSTLYPNQCTVVANNGDFFECWLSVTMQVPADAYFGNASLVDTYGARMKRSGAYGAMSTIISVVPEGGMPRCQTAGPSPEPCELYTEHVRGILGPNPIDFTYFATISLPQREETSKFYRGKVRNRNSPYSNLRPIIWITDTWPGYSNSFMFPAFDRDGDPVKSFVGGSSRAASGSDHILCEQGNMTSFGCFGAINNEDGPPYDSVNFVFGLQDKVATDSALFFYSFTMNVTDGYGAYSLAELLINYCNPVIQIGQTSIIDRAAEFIDVDAQGNIRRRRPITFFECAREGPCFVTVYAARFDDNTGTTPSRHPQQIGNLEIVMDGSDDAGHLRNQTTLANGMVYRNFTFGRLPNGHFDPVDIGSHRTACFTVLGHTKCQTPPLCITIKVRGNKPHFLAPTPPMEQDSDDVKFDVLTPTPVCAGFSVSFEIKAADADPDEVVSLNIYDSTGDGDDIFSAPYNARKVGLYNYYDFSTSKIANAMIVYELDYAAGVKRDPVTRAVSFARDRQICTVAIDNTLSHHYAFGDLNDNPLYAGNFITRPKCHLIAFSGPPAFLTSASRFDGSPFAVFDGTVEERMLTIDAFIGQEKSITFRAKDPNWDGRVTIFIMEDPGVPNGAVIGPSVCEPQLLITTWNATGLWSPCAVASRTIKWIPPPTIQYQRKPRICAIPRDSEPIPECPNPKMTDAGWYGELHCTEIQVIAPQLRWTNISELGRTPRASRNVFVPCATNFLLEAEEVGSGFNNTGVRVLTPYQPVIIFVGDVPERAALTVVTQGRTSRSFLSYTAARGDEGRVETICFTVRDDQSVLQLPTSCVTVSVKRCVYCVNPGDTLQRIMQEIALDLNWLRLWAANGNDDGDEDTETVYHPDDLMKTATQHIINVGSIYTVEKGDDVAALAVKFQTTVKQILSLNPDVAPVSGHVDRQEWLHDIEGLKFPHVSIREGQQLCIVPCAVLPRLPDEGMDNAVSVQ